MCVCVCVCVCVCKIITGVQVNLVKCQEPLRQDAVQILLLIIIIIYFLVFQLSPAAWPANLSSSFLKFMASLVVWIIRVLLVRTTATTVCWSLTCSSFHDSRGPQCLQHCPQSDELQCCASNLKKKNTGPCIIFKIYQLEDITLFSKWNALCSHINNSCLFAPN